MNAAARPGRDAGNAAVELAPVAAVFIIFLALAIFAGRVSVARNAVAAAARDAARQASIARTAPAAQHAARDEAAAALARDRLDCTPAITVDTSGFQVPVGEPAQVSVTVSCDVRLADLAVIPGIPGVKPLTATFTSPLDTFRGRS